MAFRITSLVLLGLSLAGSPVWGQGLHAHSHGGGNPWDAPDARSGGVMPFATMGPGPMMPPGAPAFPPGMHDPTAVVPAEAHHHHHGPGGHAPHPPGGIVPAGAMMPAGPMPGPAYGPEPMVYGPEGEACPVDGDARRVSWMDRAWKVDRDILRFLKCRTSGAYIRTDMLIYEIEDPGNVLMGAQPTVVGDPTQPFNVFSLQAPPQLVGTATVPTTGSMLLRDIMGMRVTYGKPVAAGHFELSFFMTEQASDQFITTPNSFGALGLPQFLANSTNLNGLPSNNFQLYDQQYNLTYTSELWGVGAKVLLEGVEKDYIRWRPTVGWRYFAVQESLVQNSGFVQTGLFTGGANVLQLSTLRSEVFNNVMGIELGLQAEAKFWIFTVGVEPALTLGPNIYKSRTITNAFAATTDPERVVNSNEYDFSPVLELGAYAKVRLLENLEARVGYDAMWFTRVQRPAKAIFYDIDGTNNTSLVRPEEDLEEMLVDGLSLALVLHFPVDCDPSGGWRR